MTTDVRSWWRSPEFSEFLPWIKASAAWDKRDGRSPRFDMKSSTPAGVVRRALAFRATCVGCGRRIAPFRARQALAKRGHGKESVYMAVTCSVRCRNGQHSRDAYQDIWSIFRGDPPASSQPGLL